MEKGLASEYARLLSRGDVVRLFARLKKETSRAEAARICGLGRRTTYDWDSIGEPSHRTKERVLEALLTRQYKETLRYLLESGYKDSRNIIRYLLVDVYEKAIEDSIQRSDFEAIVTEFDQLIVKYSGLITGAVVEEMDEMRMNLRNRAMEMGVEMNPPPLSIMSPEQIISTIKSVASRIDLPPSIDLTTLRRLSHDFWLPEEILNTTLEVKSMLNIKPSSKQLTGVNNCAVSRDLPVRALFTNQSSDKPIMFMTYGQSLPEGVSIG